MMTWSLSIIKIQYYSKIQKSKFIRRSQSRETLPSTVFYATPDILHQSEQLLRAHPVIRVLLCAFLPDPFQVFEDIRIEILLAGLILSDTTEQDPKRVYIKIHMPLKFIKTQEFFYLSIQIWKC